MCLRASSVAERGGKATGAADDTGRPASRSGDRPSRSFVLILSCSSEREGRGEQGACEEEAARNRELARPARSPSGRRVLFGRTRYFQRASAKGGRPPTGDIEVRRLGSHVDGGALTGLHNAPRGRRRTARYPRPLFNT